MAKEQTSAAVSRQLIELSLTRPPVHSFNRQLVRIVIDAVDADAATLWLLRDDELILCEEIEDSVGAVKSIRVSPQSQQQALRGAFEKGEVSVLRDRSDGFDPLAPEAETQRALVFIPVVGLRGNLGVLRLVLPPVTEPLLSRQIQLAETLSGYYSLYSAQRILSVQHEERRDIDRLSKAILQLQHYTFSSQLPEVIVNSGVEVARIDRVVLITVNQDQEPRVRAVSSVVENNKRSAWTRLACEFAEVLMQAGKPMQLVEGLTKPEEIEDEELREYTHSYMLMTNARSLLAYPLTVGDEKIGALLFETFSREENLTVFDRVLCTVFASHAASALANHRRFESLPLSRFYAQRLDREVEGVKRGRPWVGKATKWAVGLALAIAVIYLAFFMPVSEKVGAQCYVAPAHERVITAKIPGEIEEVSFAQGMDVQAGDLLIKLRTDQIALKLNEELENAKNLSTRITKLRGEAADALDPEASSRLAEVEALTHSLAAKQEQIALLRSQLEDCYLKSTIDGTVLEPDEPESMIGYVVRAGEPLCRVGSIAERVKVRLAVPDERADDVKQGLPVRIRLRPLVREEALEGEILRIGERSVTYKNSNVFMADVMIENTAAPSPEGEPQYLLKPGMTGKARVVLPGKSTYFSIYGRLILRKLSYWLY